jgi:predicted GNAT family acetyltransferase
MDAATAPKGEGQGLGSRLVTDALSEVGAAGLAVLPFCPFVRAFIASHASDYLDLVPASYRSEFGLPADE